MTLWAINYMTSRSVTKIRIVNEENQDFNFLTLYLRTGYIILFSYRCLMTALAFVDRCFSINSLDFSNKVCSIYVFSAVTFQMLKLHLWFLFKLNWLFIWSLSEIYIFYRINILICVSLFCFHYRRSYVTK